MSARWERSDGSMGMAVREDDGTEWISCEVSAGRTVNVNGALLFYRYHQISLGGRDMKDLLQRQTQPARWALDKNFRGGLVVRATSSDRAE